MPEQEFIDVRISAGGHELRDYHDKRDNEDGDRSLVRCIEAKMSKNFCIVFKLKKYFDFMDAEAVLFVFKVDNLEGEYSHLLCKKTTNARGQVLEAYGNRFRGPNSKAGKRWAGFCFKFDELNIISDGDVENPFSATDLGNLGTIRVMAQRVYVRSTNKPKQLLEKLPERHKEVPEWALKGRFIKNSVGFSKNKNTLRPQNKYEEYEPIDGPGGEAFNFIFKYYTRKSLKNLGFLPLISPEPPTKKDNGGFFTSYSSTSTRNLPPGTRHKYSGHYAGDWDVPTGSVSNENGMRTPQSLARGQKRGRDDDDDDDVDEQPSLFIRGTTQESHSRDPQATPFDDDDRQPPLFIRGTTQESHSQGPQATPCDDREYLPTPDPIAPKARQAPSRKKRKQEPIPGIYLPREVDSGSLDGSRSNSKEHKLAIAALKLAQKKRDIGQTKVGKGKGVGRYAGSQIDLTDVANSPTVVISDDDESGVGIRKKVKGVEIKTGESSGSNYRKARVETVDLSD